jgi:5-(carboxyamino)imidazole ribonucleotide synthase
VTSQFEQHLRAVLDYPLGSTAPRAPACAMVNVLGGAGAPVMGIDERVHHLMARYPQAKVHLYAKPEWPGRKIGHVTVCGAQLAAVREVAGASAAFLATGAWPDGYPVHGQGREAG